MEVVLQGRVDEEQDMQEVLGDVMALPGSRLGVLRISDPGDNLNGKLVLYQRRYVIGATISDSPDAGYSAVRKLLSVRQGNFAYLDATDELPSPEETHS